MAKLVSKVYSKALFDIAVELNLLDRIYNEFEIIVNSLKEYPSFYEIIISPKISGTEKKIIIDKIFKEKISKEFTDFIDLLIDKRRIDFIKDIFSEFKLLNNEYKGLVIAKVESVISLEKEQIKDLEIKLNKLTGKTVTVNNIINPDIVGGLVIRVGDKIIDGSVKLKLENLKNDLGQIIIWDV